MMTKINFACFCDPDLVTSLYVVNNGSYDIADIKPNVITTVDVDLSAKNGGIAFKLRSDIPLAMTHVFKKSDTDTAYVVNSINTKSSWGTLSPTTDNFRTYVKQGTLAYATLNTWSGVTSFYYIWLVPVMSESTTDGYKTNDKIIPDPTQEFVNNITNNSRPKTPEIYPFAQTLNNVKSSNTDNQLKDYSKTLFISDTYNELTDGYLFGYKPDNEDQLKNSMIVTYTPETGYAFKDPATLKYVSVFDNGGFTPTEEHMSATFNPTNEQTLIADLSFSNMSKIVKGFKRTDYAGFTKTGITVTADKVTTTVPVENTAFTALFRVNNDILNEISAKRFTHGISDTTQAPQVTDLGNYILKLFKIPFNIPDDYINGTQPIKLGFRDLGINADQLLNSAVHVELGIISVPEIYKNVYDYSSTECVLFLPFVDNITLQAQTIMGHDLKISYDIDLYTGKTTILIYLDDTKELVYQNQTNISKDIPYYLVSNDTVKGTTETTYINNTLQAYLVVLRDDPKTGQIKNFTGFNNFNDVELTTNASLSEQNEIITQLQSGVYINE